MFEGENPEITSIEMITVSVKEGSLFVCVKGYTVDGHDFAKSAVEMGRVAILARISIELRSPSVCC